jgi:peptide/nickel transport system permease protein
MRSYLLRRLAYLVPTALLATIGVFILQHLSRGGPAIAILGEHATPAAIAKLNRQLGLDHPLYQQYGTWLWGVLHGNIGTSYQDNQPVSTALGSALPVTIEIAVIALVIALVVGIPLGLAAALRPGSIIDRIVRLISGLGIAVPDFWAASLLIVLFALYVAWFPATGFVRLSAGAGGSLQSAFLPALALSLPAGATMVKQARGVFTEILSSEFMTATAAAGMRTPARLGRYALKSALPTLLNVSGLLASGIIGGTVVVEVIFALPGIGSLVVNASSEHDYPVIQGVVLCYVVIVLIINLVVDMAGLVADPRIRR